MPPSDNETRLRDGIEAIWNRHDLNAADDLFAPDFVNHGGLIVDLLKGPESVKSSAALHHLAFPHLHLTVEHSSSDAETVMLRWTARNGSSRQRLRGITRFRM